MSGRTLDLNLDLLDRQVVDRDGKLVGKVDDLELERGADDSLYVAAILVGSRALSRRLRGRPGVWLGSVAARLSHDDIPRIDMAQVSEIGPEIKLGAARADLQVAPLEDWVREHVVARIPGSRHAGE